MRRLAHRQRESRASSERGGAAAGAHDDAVVLCGRPAGADLDGARRRRPERQDLVEYEPLAQRSDQRLDASPGRGSRRRPRRTPRAPPVARASAGARRVRRGRSDPRARRRLASRRAGAARRGRAPRRRRARATRARTAPPIRASRDGPRTRTRPGADRRGRGGRSATRRRTGRCRVPRARRRSRWRPARSARTQSRARRSRPRPPRRRRQRSRGITGSLHDLRRPTTPPTEGVAIPNALLSTGVNGVGSNYIRTTEGGKAMADRQNGAQSPEQQVRALYEEAESNTAKVFEALVNKPSFGRLLALSAENTAALTRMSFDGGRSAVAEPPPGGPGGHRQAVEAAAPHRGQARARAAGGREVARRGRARAATRRGRDRERRRPVRGRGRTDRCGSRSTRSSTRTSC